MYSCCRRSKPTHPLPKYKNARKKGNNKVMKTELVLRETDAVWYAEETVFVHAERKTKIGNAETPMLKGEREKQKPHRKRQRPRVVIMKHAEFP
jgi:hypothetical protein